MKKTLLKLCAALLACCSVFGCMIFTASAETAETAELQSKWNFGKAASMSEALTFTDSVNGDNDAVRYISWGKYDNYGVYTKHYGANDMTYGATGAGPDGYIVGEVEKTDGTKETVNNTWVRYRGGSVTDPHGPYFNRSNGSQNWFSNGIAFKANQTGTVRFTLETYFKGTAKVVVGKSNDSSFKYTKGGNYDNTVYEKTPTQTTYEEWTIDVDVKEGDEIVFLVEYLNGAYNADCMLHLEKAEYKASSSETVQTKWNFGKAASMSEALTFTDSVKGDNSIVRYISWGKYDNYGDYTKHYGANDMTYGETGAGTGVNGYIVGEVEKTGETKETITDAWVRYRGGTVTDPHGPYFNRSNGSQNWFSNGIAFKANQTGTVRFTLETYFNGTAKVVVGKSNDSSFKYTKGGNYDNTVYEKTPTQTTYEEWTVDIDVKEGDEIVFLVEYLNGAYNADCMLHLEKAEYIAGDLTANPVTYVCAQETDASDGKFNVLISSAICEAKAGNAEAGYYITVKYDGVVKKEEKCVINSAYETLVAYDENGEVADRLESLQGTYWMSGVIEGLDANVNVTLIIKAFSGDYTDSEITVEYVKGVFQSSTGK